MAITCIAAAPARILRGRPPLRVYRYAIDDLRLYNALEAAGVAGWVIVVESVGG